MYYSIFIAQYLQVVVSIRVILDVGAETTLLPQTCISLVSTTRPHGCESCPLRRPMAPRWVTPGLSTPFAYLAKETS